MPMSRVEHVEAKEIPSKNITRDNHYVPRMYLKNWSIDKQTIWTYSLLVQHASVPYWRKESIKSASAWKDLYTRMVNTKDIDDFEIWFDTEFESPAKHVLDKILSGTRLGKQDNIILSKYIAAQHVRTPARLNEILALGREILPDIMQDALNKTSDIAKALNCNTSKAMDVADYILPLKLDIDSDNGIITAKSVVGKGMYLDSVRYMLTRTLKPMYKYRWHIIQSAEKVSIPTSDDPVVCMNMTNFDEYNFHNGLMKKNSIIFIPVSPKYIAITQVGFNYPFEKFSGEIEWSNFFRKVIIEHAYRYVYADSEQRGMLAINPRIVNEKLYKQEQLDIRNWYAEHTAAEQAIFT